MPKRAFPDDGWQTWFRAQAQRRSSSGEVPSSAPASLPSSSTGDQINLRVQLSYRDYLDRTTASWRTWGIFIAVAIMFIAMTLYGEAHPAPNAVNSATKMIFIFEIPFLLVMAAIMVPIISFMTWRAHKKSGLTQDLALSGEGMNFAASDGSGKLPWSSYPRYKETRWSFILWRPGTQIWTMFPKRAFQSTGDLERVRTLLASRLEKSRWFWG